MNERKPLKQRLKQDIAILLLALMLMGGAASYLAASPLFVPAVAAMLALTFGPYAVEYLSGKAGGENTAKKGKIAFSILPGENGGKDIRFEQR